MFKALVLVKMEDWEEGNKKHFDHCCVFIRRSINLAGSLKWMNVESQEHTRDRS